MSYKASLACAGAFAAAATLAGSAFAAEPAPAPPPPPPFTWTGIYVGGQIGYAWGNDDIFYNAYDPLTGTVFNPSAFNVPIVSSTPSGVIGGAHVGFNYQIDKPTAGRFCHRRRRFGRWDELEEYMSRRSLPRFGGSSVSASTNTDIQGSIRGRFGIAWDRLLIYATGGVAFGGFNTNYSFTGNTSARTSTAAPSSARTAFRTPAWAGRPAAASTMRSPTIGQYSRNIATPVSALLGIPGLPLRCLQRCQA